MASRELVKAGPLSFPHVNVGVLMEAYSGGGLEADVVAGGRLEQFPSFPGRQLSQNSFAFTQAQPLQEPDLLHLQQAILPSPTTR